MVQAEAAALIYYWPWGSDECGIELKKKQFDTIPI